MPCTAQALFQYGPKNRRGSAAIELMIMAPVAALLILVAFQFAMLFSDTVEDVAEANAKAETALREWETINAEHGFARPCLEKMSRKVFSSESRTHRIGAGKFSYEIVAPQEVRVVASEICFP
jgi:hypothetical protein